MELPEVGDTIELLAVDTENTVKPGTTAVVTFVGETRHIGSRELTQIGVKWGDTDRSLLLIVPPDRYRIVDRGLE